jgi:uncharacterized protein (UPF0218 family)
MNSGDSVTAASHPDEMRADIEAKFGSLGSLKLSARTTPAGLASVGVLVAAVLLSTAVLVRAARGRL